MLKNLLKDKKGFTLIEVVLVLAIAALIMVIVFLGVNGANAARRDTQRKDGIGRIAAALELYASNNGGSYPADVATFNTGMPAYLTPASFQDPLAGKTFGSGAGGTSASNVTAAASVVAPTGTVPAGVSYTLTGRTYNVCIGLEQGASSCRTNN